MTACPVSDARVPPITTVVTTMWTDTTRALDARSGLALPSDLTDAERRIFEPLLCPPAKTGRPRKWEMRRIAEAIFYLLRGGLP